MNNRTSFSVPSHGEDLLRELRDEKAGKIVESAIEEEEDENQVHTPKVASTRRRTVVAKIEKPRKLQLESPDTTTAQELKSVEIYQENEQSEQNSTENNELFAQEVVPGPQAEIIVSESSKATGVDEESATELEQAGVVNIHSSDKEQDVGFDQEVISTDKGSENADSYDRAADAAFEDAVSAGTSAVDVGDDDEYNAGIPQPVQPTRRPTTDDTHPAKRARTRQGHRTLRSTSKGNPESLDASIDGVNDLKKGIPMPVQPLASPHGEGTWETLGKSGTRTSRRLRAKENLRKREDRIAEAALIDTTSHSVIQSKTDKDINTSADNTETDSESVQEEEETPRGPRFDAKGREIIEPQDITALVKGPASRTHLADKVINTETFTMATLCSDIPLGETNEKYTDFETARLERKRFRAKLLQAKRMIRGKYSPRNEQKRMELLKVYKDYQEERDRKYGKHHDVDLDHGAEISAQAPTMVLQKDKSGKIILDVSSQQVDRHKDNKADDEPNVHQDRIEKDKYEAVNSYSFSNKERAERWTEEETAMFFNCLSVWGTDFNLISQFFPKRSRHQIKTKYKYEERRNAEKVQLFLVHRKGIKLDDITRVSGKQIHEVSEIELELEKVRVEHAAQLSREAEAKRQAAIEDQVRKSTAAQKRLEKKGITGTSEVKGEIGQA